MTSSSGKLSCREHCFKISLFRPADSTFKSRKHMQDLPDMALTFRSKSRGNNAAGSSPTNCRMKSSSESNSWPACCSTAAGAFRMAAATTSLSAFKASDAQASAHPFWDTACSMKSLSDCIACEAKLKLLVLDFIAARTTSASDLKLPPANCKALPSRRTAAITTSLSACTALEVCRSFMPSFVTSPRACAFCISNASAISVVTCAARASLHSSQA
mmetsp:Transcript_20083/g.46800  ORF Transcript_20083/g.46800 Transcript_20083/m.46800 type:complete len:216 (-) Transcript_20083:7-654(-)